jgi:hypothetical protein
MLLSACEKEEIYSSCPFTKSIKEDCDNSSFSCVVKKHPNCETGICLIYKYKDIVTQETWETSSFCSRECAVDKDCPEEAYCREIMEDHFCVPKSYLESAQPAL